MKKLVNFVVIMAGSMNFTLKLSLSEIVKNKSKVLIAIIVTLILFMSAFTLCNIATALPNNFYRYYEEYMPDTIGIWISNADEDLYNNSEKYFEEFEANFGVACNINTLGYNSVKMLPYEDVLDEEGNLDYTIYYNTSVLYPDCLEVQNIDIYREFFIYGEIWNPEKEELGIWISDFVVEKFEKEGAIIAVNDYIDYDFNGTTIKLQVKGIYDEEALRNYIASNIGINFESLSKYTFYISVPSAKKILFDSKTSFSAYGIVGEIDKLYDVYNALHNKYSLSEGTAFSLITQVKNTQVICMIVGVIMIICGIVIMLNFINMIISQNIKHISLLRILGTNTFRIMMAYFIIFILLITIVCVISWMTLPLYNYFVSLYCAGLGYPFMIDINYWVVVGVFAICYFIITAIMLVKWAIMDKTAPIKNIAEED